MASEMILTDPEIIPTTSFNIIRPVFEKMDSLAALIFLFIAVWFSQK
jgi:hypothetical protein